MERVQVLVSAEEKEAFRRLAEREGLSLSAWLRQAGLVRQKESEGRRKIRTVDELRAFFNECDRRETAPEPDWEDHLKVIKRSIRSGSSDT